MSSPKHIVTVFFLLLLLSACGGADMQEPASEKTEPVTATGIALETAIGKAFENWVDVPYQNQQFEVVENDGTFATVRVVAEFRETAESGWKTKEATVGCRKVGDEWRCDKSFDFHQVFAMPDFQPPDFRPDDIILASVAKVDDEFGIYVIYGSGEIKNLTTGLDVHTDTGTLDWSPDGEKIAFTVRRDYPDIYVINSDGSGLTNLTDNPNGNQDPVWSPDGKQLAFTSKVGELSQIHVMSKDGTGLRRISDGLAHDFEPRWSPDGRQIAFISWRGEGAWGGDVYVMNADGSGGTRLTNNPSYRSVWQPVWSPNAHSIVFTSDHEGEGDKIPHIYLVDSTSGELTRITDHPDGETDHALSPDGRKIAFIRGDIHYLDAFVSNVDGTGVINLTDTIDEAVSTKGSTAWSPDSKLIAFSTGRGVYVVSADGSEIVKLVERPGRYFSLAWWPKWTAD